MSLSICSYVTWFAIFSVIGWLYECLFVLLRRGFWDNRGVLYGPVCPIYGTGGVAVFLLFDNPAVADGAVSVWVVFLTCMTGSAVLEYTTSVLLERRFHARWWDYSNLPLNFQGRICLWTALGFGAAGVAVCYLAIPGVEYVTALLPQWFWEVSAVIVTFVLAADTSLTVAALTDLAVQLEESQQNFNARMEARVEGAHAKVDEFGEAASSRAHDATQVASNAAAMVSAKATSAVVKVSKTASDAKSKASVKAASAVAKVEGIGEAVTTRVTSMSNAYAMYKASKVEDADQEAPSIISASGTIFAAAPETIDAEKTRDSEAAGKLTFRQRHALRNIRTYTDDKAAGRAGRLRTYISRRESLGEAFSDIVSEVFDGVKKR